jgi:hypothetical protein
MVLVGEHDRSRRELLAAAAGGVLALVATAIGRPLPTRAADGEAMVVGGEYTSTTVTRITTATSRGTAIRGNSDSGIAIHGVSGSYVGVWGESTSVMGVRGISTSASGVAGSSASGAGITGDSASGPGVGGQSPVVGVHGNSAPGVAVRGDTVSGFGVYGRADSGTGLYGSSASSYALHTKGRLRFDRAGSIATVAAGARSVVVTPGFDLTANTKVLATLQGSAGGVTTIHRVSVNAAADTFTIYLTANAARAVHVAYLVIG